MRCPRYRNIRYHDFATQKYSRTTTCSEPARTERLLETQAIIVKPVDRSMMLALSRNEQAARFGVRKLIMGWRKGMRENVHTAARQAIVRLVPVSLLPSLN